MTVKRFSDFVLEFLSGLIMTAVCGVFLAISLLLMLSEIQVPFDPAWLAVIISGLPIAYSAVYELVFERSITSELLITIAMVASIFIGELFAAGEVAFIMAIGAILEDKTIDRAKKGLMNLVSLSPSQGRRIGPDGEQLIPVEQIQPGDILRVLPGESIPADGEIVFGDTSVDQSIMTGESLPVDKSIGDSVFCGTLNHFGSVDIKAEKGSEDSALSKLIRMVRDAQEDKAPMQRVVDRWASLLVPAALVIAVLVFVFTRDITRSVTVLVVFCPCALALATPTSIMAAIGQASKYGIIIKSGDALERMSRVDCVAFDKTGTITNGSLTVSDVISFCPELSADELLVLAASAERYSEHPLGKAIVQHAKDKGISFKSADSFKMIPGSGIISIINQSKVLCGSESFLRAEGVTIEKSVTAVLNRLRSQGKAVILIGRDISFLGVAALSDTLRSCVPAMIRELGQVKAEPVLLTGDHLSAAEYFAAQSGIKSVFAGLLPAMKVEKIKELQLSGRSVCMIGDGVNDAPALKTADISVAMGQMGSDIAVETADIALMGDDISKIPYLKRLSAATVKLIKFNISASMIINLIAIILSVFALLNPVTGALVHNAGSVLVVLNAALLYDRKKFALSRQGGAAPS